MSGGKLLIKKNVPVLISVLDTGFSISRRELAEKLIEGSDGKSLVRFVVQKCEGMKINIVDLKKKIRLFVTNFGRLWKKSSRTRSRFFGRNAIWLRGCLTFCKLQTSKASKGRPSKPFDELSRRSKLRKIHDVAVEIPCEQLMFAAATSATNSGFRVAGQILENLSKHPENATVIKQSMSNTDHVEAYSAEETLAFICKNGFSKRQYEDVRLSSQQKGSYIYPSYTRIVEAKKLCYPEGTKLNYYSKLSVSVHTIFFLGIMIRSSAAEVSLQNLVDHTNARLIESQKTVLAKLPYDKYEVKYKWGCDGSSNHSRYKLDFVEEDEDGELTTYNDSHIFSIALVPLRLDAQISVEETEVCWNNDLPSSVSLCRPIKLMFAKEEAKLTREEVKKVQDQIKMLKPTECILDGRKIMVSSSMVLSMMDTKVINDLTGTNSQSCFMCGLSGKKLNDAAKQQDPDDPDKFGHGFSPLHAYIRSMELFLKVSYRLKMEKPTWRVAKTNEKVRQREVLIRSEIREKLGLRISEPMPGGGNSNDGNTARKFFREWRVVCEITGLNKELLERMHNILAVINSNCEINIDSFSEYIESTRELYVSEYEWYPLSPTLHKLLVHGRAIVKHAILPVGMYSEEALETRNKSIRKFRENHSRRFNRIVNITDVYQRLMLTSDPVISLLNRAHRNAVDSSLPVGALSLIKTMNC